MVIRVDDVSPNTDQSRLDELVSVIRNLLPDADFLIGVTFFGKYSPNGAIYPDLPLKEKPMRYFFDVNRFVHNREFPGKICSHGLWHFDHQAAELGLAEASIVTSCKLLMTDTFIPPFNRWDFLTEKICKENGITLIKSQEEGWRSFECNEFDPSHQNWYFHPWRWTPETLRTYLTKKMVAA